MTPSYIPASRQALVDRLSTSDQLTPADRGQFRQFCEILSAYAHFTGQKDLELMKLAFANFDPHEAPAPAAVADANGRAETANVFAQAFERTAKRANFQPLAEAEVRAALEQVSHVPVRMAVDFDVFERVAFYFRRRNEIPITVRRWFRRRRLGVANYERLAVLLQVREPAAFERRAKLPGGGLQPGRIYLGLYRDIPHHDLGLLLPNLDIGMSFKNRLVLAVSAAGAAIPIAFKIVPGFALLLGAVALFVFGWEPGGRFAVSTSDDTTGFVTLTAALAIVLALGGFAAAQSVKYGNRCIALRKKITDMLFFRTLDVGKGVLAALIDAAEDEECKAMMLVFFILVVNQRPMDANAVATAAEDWLVHAFGCEVDFDATKALDNLAAIRGAEDEVGASLVTRTERGEFTAVTLREANTLIDRIWDKAFQY